MDLSLAASVKRVIHPEESILSQAAISLPGEFQRAQSSIITTDMAQQRRWLEPGFSRHGATICYRVDNASLVDGSVIARSYFDQIATVKAVRGQRLVHIDEAALVSSDVIYRYFGHWILDGLCLERLAFDQHLMPISITREPWLHEIEYRRLAAMPPPPAPRRLKIGKLWVIDDRGLNAGRAKRAQTLNASVRANFRSTRPTRLFLGRGTQGKARDLVNEAEVVAALEKRGFERIEPETMSAKDIAFLLSTSQIVVGVEGSALSHTNIASPPGCVILNIQPPDRFNALGKKNADALGQRYAYTVAEPREGGRFHQPIHSLLKTIDLIEALT